MTQRMMFTKVLATALSTSVPPRAAAGQKHVPMVKLHVQQEVAASPAVVWEFMTTHRNFITFRPNWKRPAQGKVSVTQVGDVLEFTDEWGNSGRSIVTYLEKEKELRVAHEPNKGDYVRQARMVLSPSGGGTVVHCYESYTDASAPKNMEATAQQTERDMRTSLSAIKATLEGK